MTPAAFRAIRLRLGVTQAAIGFRAGFRGDAQVWVSHFERGRPVTTIRRDAMRRALLELRREDRDRRRRQPARDRWAAAWPGLSARYYLVQAANLLDRWGDHELADCLLAARPAYVTDVCTGVVVHALLRHAAPDSAGMPDGTIPEHPWDILVSAGLVNYPQACDWFDDATHEAFEWSPEPHWLLP